MSDKEINKIVKIIKIYGKEVSSNKEKAIESLKKAGICDSKGKLRAQYR